MPSHLKAAALAAAVRCRFEDRFRFGWDDAAGMPPPWDCDTGVGLEVGERMKLVKVRSSEFYNLNIDTLYFVSR